MASYCLQRLFPCAGARAPDLLLVDFAVNDWMGTDDVVGFEPAINIERLIREVLLYLPGTAVMLTHFSQSIINAMQSAEHLYKAPALHYHVPEVSSRRHFADWLWQTSDYPQFDPVYHRLLVPGERLLSDHWPLPTPATRKAVHPVYLSHMGASSVYGVKSATISGPGHLARKGGALGVWFLHTTQSLQTSCPWAVVASSW